MQKVSQLLLSIFFLLTGILGMAGSFRFDFVTKSLPGPGFFPMLLSIIVSVFAVIMLINTFKMHKKDDAIDMTAIKRACLFVLLLAVCLAVLPDIIGFLPALAVFYVAALYYWNGLSLRGALINGTVCMALLYGIFFLWLGIDLPGGMLHDMLFD